MNFREEYRKKLTKPEDAVSIIKSGDNVNFGPFACAPIFLDQHLAQRAGELENVTIQSITFPAVCRSVLADPERKSFIFRSSHFSKADRILHDRGLCDYIPNLFHEGPSYFNNGYIRPDVSIVRAAPMDKWGFFNVGIGNSVIPASLEQSKKVIIEVNENIPYCYGGFKESIHISRVDHIVESDNAPIIELPRDELSERHRTIAAYIIDEIIDGACLQLGIGALPNAVGELIAHSDLKDLGVQTEMLCDAYFEMFERGKITGAKKTFDPGKMSYTFALGSRKLYDFLDHNQHCASFPVDYINSLKNISANDNVISINNAIEIDLYGQVSAESSGFRHISGTGGQLDFVYGAYHSRGGKSFICLSSTYTDKEGRVRSRITPTLEPGTIVTVHRAMVHYVVTEYGKAMLKGKSTRERAEELIRIAHPDFREELIREAERMNLWTRTAGIA